MKRETLFLKFVVILIGLPVLVLSILGVPWLLKNPVSPNYAKAIYPVIIGIYLTTIPFYIALFKAFNLLNYIDKNIAFSDLSVKALKYIKYCAITISGLYGAMEPFVYIVAEKDDAPGLIIFGLVPIFAAMVIAGFAAVLEKLLKNAIDIKSDNDLTI